MRFASAISGRSETLAAVDDVLAGLVEALDGQAADIAFLFVSPHHVHGNLREAQARIRTATGAGAILGCTGEGIIGDGAEHERKASLSLLAGRLPGSTVRTFAISQGEMEEAVISAPPEVGEAEGDPEARGRAFWTERLGGAAEPGRPLFLLADPFTFDAGSCVALIDQVFPGVPVLGGMASGARRPGGHRLLIDGEVIERGAVGAYISGPFRFDVVVSQGCRPIGRPLVITGAEQNIIKTLGGRPAMAALQEVFEELSEAEKKLAQTALHVGCVIDECKENFGRGDFVIRNPMGFDPRSGAIAVGDLMRRGQTIQFHVRDAASAEADLKSLLAEYRSREKVSPAGALLFSCSGRGQRLFEEEDHDSRILREVLGQVPLAGFFCAGEFGPVRGRNFLHGFTSAVGIFGPAASSA